MDFGCKPHWLAVLVASAAVSMPPSSPPDPGRPPRALAPRGQDRGLLPRLDPGRPDRSRRRRVRQPTAARSRGSRAMWNGERRPPRTRGPGTPGFSTCTTRQRRVGAERGVHRRAAAGARARSPARCGCRPGRTRRTTRPSPTASTGPTTRATARSRASWHWFGDERIDDFKLIVRGSGQRARRRRSRAAPAGGRCGAVVALRGDGRASSSSRRDSSSSQPTRRRDLRRRRSARGRRVRLRLDHQRRHARKGLEADLARLGAGRRRREEPDGAHLRRRCRPAGTPPSTRPTTRTIRPSGTPRRRTTRDAWGLTHPRHGRRRRAPPCQTLRLRARAGNARRSSR